MEVQLALRLGGAVPSGRRLPSPITFLSALFLVPDVPDFTSGVGFSQNLLNASGKEAVCCDAGGCVWG